MRLWPWARKTERRPAYTVRLERIAPVADKARVLIVIEACADTGRVLYDFKWALTASVDSLDFHDSGDVFGGDAAMRRATSALLYGGPEALERELRRIAEAV